MKFSNLKDASPVSSALRQQVAGVGQSMDVALHFTNIEHIFGKQEVEHVYREVLCTMINKL